MQLDILLDVLGQTRHQVVAVLVERLALGLEGVDGVHDGALERLGGVARGELRCTSAKAPPSQVEAMQLPTRMLGVSVFSPAISFARRAVVENARAAVERAAAAANGRLTASRIAIVCVFGRRRLRGAAGRGGLMGEGGGEGGTSTDVHEARLLACKCSAGEDWPVRATSGQAQSLAVAAPVSNALAHPPANSSASLFLTRPAFVCVLCICRTHPTNTHPRPHLRPSLGTLPRWPPLCPQRIPAHRRSESLTHPPCRASSMTSSSTTTRTSAARSASRSSTCPTGTSGHVPAATKYALALAHARVQRLRTARTDAPPDMPVLLQQHQDNDERAVPGLSPSLRRLDHRVQEHHPRRVGPLALRLSHRPP